MSKIIYEKCADLMFWIVENKTNTMPANVFANICEQYIDEVLEELHSHSSIFFSTDKTIWSIKNEDAKMLFTYYSDKVNRIL